MDGGISVGNSDYEKVQKRSLCLVTTFPAGALLRWSKYVARHVPMQPRRSAPDNIFRDGAFIERVFIRHGPLTGEFQLDQGLSNRIRLYGFHSFVAAVFSCLRLRKAENNCHGGDFGGAESMCARSKLWRGKSGGAPNREFLVLYLLTNPAFSRDPPHYSLSCASLQSEDINSGLSLLGLNQLWSQ